MSVKPIIIKLGGAILNAPQALANLFVALGELDKQPLVLVHGGGIIVDELLSGLGKTSEKLEGLRVTPLDQIPFVVGALAGTSNKLLCAQAKTSGFNAVGLCLGDGNMTQVEQLDPRLGQVGKCKANDARLLEQLLGSGFMPVISSIGIGEQGDLYNVNADDAAIVIASLLQAPLLLLSDVPGVLGLDGKVIAEITPKTAQQLIDAKVITDGMLVKVKAALEASANIGAPVNLASWKQPAHLAQFLRSLGESPEHKIALGQAQGTRIVGNTF